MSDYKIEHELFKDVIRSIEELSEKDKKVNIDVVPLFAVKSLIIALLNYGLDRDLAGFMLLVIKTMAISSTMTFDELAKAMRERYPEIIVE